MDTSQLHQLIVNALMEDIGEGDHSTRCCIPPDKTGKAVLKIKQPGVLAGVAVAEYIFRHMEADCRFNRFMADGDKMKIGDVAFEVEAGIHTILMAERLVLNIMQRMSGIATLTNTYTEKLKPYSTRLLDTRKTTPNFRLLEKEAVRIGGGENHRFGLYDMIMLKDNHIDYSGGITNAITRASEYVKDYPHLKIEIETRSLEDVKEVLAVGKVNRIMLDNFKPHDVVKAVEMINGKFETEASGGINLGNLEEYAASGVDYISSGSVIHQAVSLDLSLKAVIL